MKVFFAIVVALMLALPAGSIGLEVVAGAHGLSWLLVAKWFVFWSVGARLFLAGFRQVVQPRYTAEVILSLKHEESHFLVRELGFANLAVGVAGLASLHFLQWRAGFALVGGVFYSLAGINHLCLTHRSRIESVVMLTDLIVGLVLLAAFAGIVL